MSVDWAALKQAARAVRQRAHAPYSDFRVGACLLGSDGNLYVGTNVENASYGLTVCAERNAVAAAVAAGVTSFAGLAICSGGATPATPCGACRQVLGEFGSDFTLVCFSVDNNEQLELRRDELLPNAFRL